MTAIPTPPIGCPSCDARWGGLDTAHCSACHETFTATSAFDKHRAGSHAAGTRHCVEPSTAGLVQSGRAYSCWQSPGAYFYERSSTQSDENGLAVVR